MILRQIVGKRAKNRFIASAEGRMVRQVDAFLRLRAAAGEVEQQPIVFFGELHVDVPGVAGVDACRVAPAPVGDFAMRLRRSLRNTAASPGDTAVTNSGPNCSKATACATSRRCWPRSRTFRSRPTITGWRVMLMNASKRSCLSSPRSTSLIPGMRIPSWQISVAPGELPPGRHGADVHDMHEGRAPTLAGR